MLAILRRLFRWSARLSSPGLRLDRGLAAEIFELRTQLAEERSRIRILTLEQEALLAVIERDRARVTAELQSFAASIVAAERKSQDGGG